MERIDRLMVDKGIVVSRTQAQRLILAGKVQVSFLGQVESPRKYSQKYPESTDIDVAWEEGDRFVSRGGLKLAGALDECGLDIHGFTVLDVGQSTGGFTDCSLQRGASRVIGVDVGHNQLASALRGDSRVVCLEGINARQLPVSLLQSYADHQGFDLIVMDVSFISQTLILPSLISLMKCGGYLLSLVKPQFEVGLSGLGKGGLVKDESKYPKVEKKVRDACLEHGLRVQQFFDSPIRGGDGNREFFIISTRQ
ncbi:16S/23S rRNA (cytidine-2'-O)-methyltransferase TlyA [invertebrate metagenome]|uniref:16S/23S rRNA (Cytidine-2'-O)-methyltransferase TlyA n=1 Tax=invertebrate metagenome TaxID=1711999 RepID=A0A2H9T977_9ZZZZ